MRDRFAQWVTVFLLTIVVATSYWYARVLRKPIANPPTPAGVPDFVVERVVITQFDATGHARHKLYAERLTHFLENDDIELVAPRLVSLRPDQPRVQVRARLGRIEHAGERVHLFGGVEVTREAGGGEPALRLASEYLLALPDLDRYVTDQPVQVAYGDSVITARAAQLDNLARTVEFDGEVRARFVAPSREGS
ncbi:MAG: LPS export ABC transporter periplasmic protein LptC [Sutterellaceae bacterium]|nr:LPS export ABC transporter periplasmic protein LptC [Burkholderiaceae bacterium]MDW8430251.1 LPS export ABC transporter periplasmic protein LptC [Sutterellaceae bacterium]